MSASQATNPERVPLASDAQCEVEEIGKQYVPNERQPIAALDRGSTTQHLEVGFKQLLVWLSEQHDRELAAMQKSLTVLTEKLAAAEQQMRVTSEPQVSRGVEGQSSKATNLSVDMLILEQSDPCVANRQNLRTTSTSPAGQLGPRQERSEQSGVGVREEELITSSEIGNAETRVVHLSRTAPPFKPEVKQEWCTEARPIQLFDGEDEDDLDDDAEDGGVSTKLSNTKANINNGGDNSCVYRFMQRCIISPASSRAATLGMFTFVVVIFDLMSIPLQVFQPPEHLFFITTRWFTQIFWNFDLLMSFFIGYYRNGLVVMEPVSVLTHYMKSWFCFDALVVGIDWLMFAMRREDVSSAGISRFGKTLRGLKFLRVLRLMKTAKVFAEAESLEDFFSADILDYLSVFKLMCGILILNHLLACGWYGVGDISGESGWITRDGIKELPFFQKYSNAYNWAITCLGVGNNEHVPFATGELVFTNITLMLGLVVFSSVVSAVTASVAALQEQRAYHTRQFRLFRKFCTDYELPRNLRRRAKSYLEHKLDQKQQKLQMDQIPIFELLSKPLRAEVTEGMYLPVLRTEIFMRRLANRVPGLVRKLIFRALNSEHLSTEDVIFSHGEFAVRAVIMFDGKLAYEHHVSGAHECIETSRWIAQACLWLKGWLYTGKLKALIDSEILCIEASLFTDTICTHVEAWEVAHRFAQFFCDGMVSAGQCSDLFAVKSVEGSTNSFCVIDQAHNQSKATPRSEWVFGRGWKALTNHMPSAQ